MFIELPTFLAATAEPALGADSLGEGGETLTLATLRRGERALAGPASRIRATLARDGRLWPAHAHVEPAGFQGTFTLQPHEQPAPAAG